MNNNKRKKITLKYHIVLDVITSTIIYLGTIICSLYLSEKISIIADDQWDNRFRFAIAIVTLFYCIISVAVIYKKKRKKWILYVEPDGNIQYEDKYSNTRQKVLCYYPERTIMQAMLGLCNIILYDLEGRKIKKIKNVSVAVKKYL